MTEPPRTLQERLRDCINELRGVYISVVDPDTGYDDDGYTPDQCEKVADQIELLIPELAAQSQLLAEAREALQGLHDNCVEYARINNLHNADGSPATDHTMRQVADVLAKLKAASGEG